MAAETLTGVQQRWFTAGAEELTDLELAATFLSHGRRWDIALTQARILLRALEESSDCSTLTRRWAGGAETGWWWYAGLCRLPHGSPGCAEYHGR